MSVIGCQVDKVQMLTESRVLSQNLEGLLYDPSENLESVLQRLSPPYCSQPFAEKPVYPTAT